MSDLVERLRDAAALPTGLYAEAADEIERKDAAIADLVAWLKTAINQVEYLHGKFHETGSGNGLIAQWKQLIAKYDK